MAFKWEITKPILIFQLKTFEDKFSPECFLETPINSLFTWVKKPYGMSSAFAEFTLGIYNLRKQCKTNPKISSLPPGPFKTGPASDGARPGRAQSGVGEKESSPPAWEHLQQHHEGERRVRWWVCLQKGTLYGVAQEGGFLRAHAFTMQLGWG